MDDLCFMLDSMGLRTGVDLERLVQVRRILERNLPAGEMRGALARAGLPRHYRSAAERAGGGTRDAGRASRDTGLAACADHNATA